MGASRKIGGLTFKDRQFVREYIKNKGNGKRAMQKVSPNAKPNTWEIEASKRLNKPHIKSKIIEALDKAGLNEDYIAKTLKDNIGEGIGKGSTATTVNKSLELLLKLREKPKESINRNYNLYAFQGIENLSNSELIDKRSKTNEYFTKIIDQ